MNSPLDQSLRERIFYVLLQSPPQRPRPVIAVRTRFLEDPLACFRRQDHLDLPVDQRIIQLTNQQIDNPEQVLIAQRIEQDYLVQPVQKFRIERSLYFP